MLLAIYLGYQNTNVKAWNLGILTSIRDVNPLDSHPVFCSHLSPFPPSRFPRPLDPYPYPPSHSPFSLPPFIYTSSFFPVLFPFVINIHDTIYIIRLCQKRSKVSHSPYSIPFHVFAITQKTLTRHSYFSLLSEITIQLFKVAIYRNMVD